MIIPITLFVHGIIHLLGFARAFYPEEINQFTAVISKPAGSMWLLTSLLLIFSALMVTTSRECWWMVALPAVMASHILIIICWQDARFGTIPNLIIFLALLDGFATWNFKPASRLKIVFPFHPIFQPGLSG